MSEEALIEEMCAYIREKRMYSLSAFISYAKTYKADTWYAVLKKKPATAFMLSKVMKENKK